MNDRVSMEKKAQLKQALKVRFKDPENEDAYEEVNKLLKEYLKSKTPETAHQEIERIPWMEDEIFGGGDHKNVRETLTIVEEIVEDLKEDFS